MNQRLSPNRLSISCRRRFVLVVILSMTGTIFGVNAEDGDTTQLPGHSEQTRKRLAQAEITLGTGDATTATNQLQQIIDEAGGDWVEVEPGRFLPARTIAQQLLARLPVADLQRYQDRIDAPAKKLLDTGLKNNDPAPLRTLVTRYSVSRHAEAALLRLGDLALERGDARRAESYWTQLQSNSGTLPDSPTKPEELQARIILARILQDDQAGAEKLLKQLETEHPDAQGSIAGVEGKLADTLQSLLKNPPRLNADSGPKGWPTFGRTPERVNRVPATPSYYWPERPSWQVRFPTAERPNPTTLAWQTAYHPVVLKGVAYVAVADHVLGYDVQTGTLQFEYNSRTDPRIQNTTLTTNVPVERPQRLTLSVGNDRIYARLGNPQITSSNDDSVIVEFDSALQPIRYLRPPKLKDEQAVWEGAPLCVKGRIYALLTRFEGTRINHVVACYGLSSSELLWVRPLSNAPIDTGTPREEHLLLSYADGKIVFASHTGVVVAIHAETGEPVWAVQYPSISTPISPYRSRSPAIVDQGRVFVAPVDSPRILALDGDSGKTLWQSEELEIEQLLGVSWGRLIATIHKPNRGIRGFDAATGSDRGSKGWRVHDDPLLQTFGLGIVSNNLILWPTRYGTFILRSDAGTLVRQAIRGVRGNLIFADGMLIVATPTGLQAYRSDDLVEPPLLSQTEPIQPTVPGTNLNPQIEEEFNASQATIPDRPRWNEPIRVAERTELPTVFAWPLPAKNLSDSPLSLDVPLMFMSDSMLLRYDANKREIAWSVPIESKLFAVSVQLFNDAMLLVGRFGLAVHNLDNGEQRWATVLPREPSPSHLDSVEPIGPQIITRVNESHLIAWDSISGKANWIRDSMNRPQFALIPMPGTPTISEAWSVADNTLLAQTDQGEIMYWDLGRGSIRSTQTSFPRPWQSPPIHNSGGSVVFPVAPGIIECHNVVTSKRIWTKQLSSHASWAGAMPQLRRIANELYVAIKMNHGVELFRLDVQQGDSSWSETSVVLPVAEVDLSNMVYDKVKLYMPTLDRLLAINRTNGQLVWSQPWPDSIDATSWKLIVGQRSLLAYPSTPILVDRLTALLQRLLFSMRFRNPTTWLPTLPWNLYDAWMRRTLPMLQYDLETGKLRQRIDLADVGFSVDVRLGTKRLAVATNGKIYWLTTD